MVGEMAQNGLYYVSHAPTTGKEGYESAVADAERGGDEDDEQPLFSLEGFIPLLQERIYVVASTARMHLLSWIDVSLLALFSPRSLSQLIELLSLLSRS
jgi:hypothetical protein